MCYPKTLFVNRGLSICGASMMLMGRGSGDMGPLICLDTTRLLRNILLTLEHYHWPPKSPDMSIIEDIRDALLHAVEKRFPPPHTPMDLLTALQN
ncbi:hypothetical protein AVEN_64944-1 [Araneus ventricosus]|uniref:Uncharacterized protein n=1 Tax=Araneus ventricosus TaxID=182803 RepID=A0A4Y2V9K1_ARAVE|nr:hypothetical protein AVEN_64944-1 [Araneus ventricosus]